MVAEQSFMIRSLPLMLFFTNPETFLGDSLIRLISVTLFFYFIVITKKIRDFYLVSEKGFVS
jgi:hypothetical protein